MTLKKNGNLTEGVIWKQLLLFAIPLLIGNLFQQLYNTVDSVIVGNFAGNNALAAVGTSGPLINMLVGFFIGLGSGATVLIARYFGAQMMRTVIPFYVFLIFHQVISGAVRGAGYTTMPMISAVFSFTFLRQIFLNTFMSSVQDVSLVFWSYALTWGVSGIIMLCYTLFGPWKKCLKPLN